MEDLRQIILKGKLKTYNHSAGFLDVYWEESSLPQGSYWLFRFAGTTYNLIEVKKITPEFIPIKDQVRKYNPIINKLMNSLLS